MHEHMEKIMALHDAELPEDEAREVRELLARDPEAQRCLQMLESADAAFAESAGPLLNETVPQRLVDVVSDSKQHSAQVVPFPRRRALSGLAIAAGLAAILITGTPELLKSGGAGGEGTGSPEFAGLLQQTLEKLPSGEIRSIADGATQIMPLVTYRTDDARFCREYMAKRGDLELEGLACRDAAGTWEVISQWALNPTDDNESYRAAGGADNDYAPLQQLGEKMSLSFAEESAVLLSGWKPSAP